MKNYFLAAFIVMAVAVSFITAPALSIAAETKSAMSDSWVTAKTKIGLAGDSRVKGTQVSVETKNGEVMLRGKVDSDEAKKAAAEVAKGVDGVKSVKNDLQVVAPSIREAVEEKDDNITDRVKEEIKKDQHLKDADISVKTNAGVVSLTGKVSDLATSAEASWIARNVPGVKSVKNDLSLEKEG